MKNEKYFALPLSKIKGNIAKLVYENANKESFIHNNHAYIPVVNFTSNPKTNNKLKTALTSKGYKNYKKNINLENIDLDEATQEFNVFIHRFKKEVDRINARNELGNKFNVLISRKIDKMSKVDALELIKKQTFFSNDLELEVHTEFVKSQEKKNLAEAKKQALEDRYYEVSVALNSNDKSKFESLSTGESLGFIAWMRKQSNSLNQSFKTKKELDEVNKNKIAFIISLIEVLELDIMQNFLSKEVLKSFYGENLPENILNSPSVKETKAEVKQKKKEEQNKSFDYYKARVQDGTFRVSMLSKQERLALFTKAENLFKPLYTKLKNNNNLSEKEKENLLYSFKAMGLQKPVSRTVFTKVYEHFPEIRDILSDSLLLRDSENKKKQMQMIRSKLQSVEKSYRDEWITSIDLEFKGNASGNATIFEVGYTLKNIAKKKLIVKNFIIEENAKRSYKPFNDGVTKHVSLEDAVKELNRDFLRVERDGGMLVGNGIKFDVDEIKKHGAKLHTDKIIDLTQMLTFIDKNDELTSLQSMLEILNIEYKNLHNAANDSYYSVRAFVKLLMKYQSQNNDRFIKKSIETKMSNKPSEMKKLTSNSDKKIKAIKKMMNKPLSPVVRQQEDVYKDEIFMVQNLYKTLFKDIKGVYPTFTSDDLFKVLKKDLSETQLVVFRQNIYLSLNNAAYITQLIQEKFPKVEFSTDSIFERNSIINSNDFSIISSDIFDANMIEMILNKEISEVREEIKSKKKEKKTLSNV